MFEYPSQETFGLEKEGGVGNFHSNWTWWSALATGWAPHGVFRGKYIRLESK